MAAFRSRRGAARRRSFAAPRLARAARERAGLQRVRSGGGRGPGGPGDVLGSRRPAHAAASPPGGGGDRGPGPGSGAAVASTPTRKSPRSLCADAGGNQGGLALPQGSAEEEPGPGRPSGSRVSRGPLRRISVRGPKRRAPWGYRSIQCGKNGRRGCKRLTGRPQLIRVAGPARDGSRRPFRGLAAPCQARAGDPRDPTSGRQLHCLDPNAPWPRRRAQGIADSRLISEPGSRVRAGSKRRTVP